MEKLVDEYCKGCIFLSQIHWPGFGRSHCCDYIGYHGHSRGCPPGKGCTQKYTGTDREAEEWKRKALGMGGYM